VTIQLRPVVRAATAAGAPTSALPSEPAGAGGGVARLRVLVVDDEPLVARSLGRLVGRGHDVSIEHSAEAALMCIQDGPRFDLVLSDLTMPGMDGVTFLMTAETIDAGLEGRIVVVTGGTSPEIEVGLHDRGVTVLYKPLELAAVRALLAAWSPRTDRLIGA
jgi:CheY-like chemotaxis protein